MSRFFLAALSVITILSCSSRKPENEQIIGDKPVTIGSIESIDQGLDNIVPPDAVIEVLAEGHEWTEGPVWVPALEALLYSDIPNNAIYKWSEGDTASIWLKPSGYTGNVPRGGEGGSNGLA